MPRKKKIKEEDVTPSVITAPVKPVEPVTDKRYFAEREEKALVDYINAKTIEERHKIYKDLLRKPFQKW